MQWSGQRGSNPRPQPWQGCALPTEPCPLARKYYTRNPSRAQASTSSAQDLLFKRQRGSSPGCLLLKRARKRGPLGPLECTGGEARIPCIRGADARRLRAPPRPRPLATGARAPAWRSRRQRGSNLGRARRGRAWKRGPLGPLECTGGEARIRTGGKGFAGLCLTTWPLRRI